MKVFAICRAVIFKMYTHRIKDCNRFFSMIFGMQLTYRLIFTYGSINKNQSLGEQTVFRNSLKKKVLQPFSR